MRRAVVRQVSTCLPQIFLNSLWLPVYFENLRDDGLRRVVGVEEVDPVPWTQKDQLRLSTSAWR